MPAAFRLFMDLTGVGLPEAIEFRRFVLNLFEGGIGNEKEHKRPRKPFTVGEFRHLGSGAWSLDVTIARDELASLVIDRMRPGTHIQLSPLSGRLLGPPLLVAERTWSQLADARPLRCVEFSILTPMVFTNQAGQHPAPTAQLIFGHFRDRWREWSPATEPRVAFGDLGWSVTANGVSIPRRTPTTKKHGGKQYKDVVGFVGTVSIEVVKASRSERVALAALASAAPFLGVGSQTQSGFGAASVLSMVFDD